MIWRQEQRLSLEHRNKGLSGEGGVLATRRRASPRDKEATAGLMMVRENPTGWGQWDQEES